MKLVNSNSFTATNTVRSAATITVLVLCLSAAHGENLTVLDGQSYTNITEISKYPNQIHFTCDEKRISVAITNLPEEFLSKYAIKKPTASVSKGLIRIEIQTNKASELTGKSKEVEPTPQLDSILLQHTDSNLFVETNAQCGCTVRFWTKQFVLDVFNSEFYTGSASDGSRVEEDFQYGQEVALNQVFNKFLEWDNIASKNNTEGFRKEIPHDFAGHVFIFCWDAHAKTSRLFLTANTLACFRKDQVIMLQNILKDFPEFKGQLVKMVERQAAQKNLFK